MGAQLCIRRFPSMPQAQLRAAVEDQREQDIIDDGQSYSGTRGSKPRGLVIESSRIFDSEEAGEDYIGERSDKEDELVAVRLRVSSPDAEKPGSAVSGTADPNATAWLVGGWCPS